MLNLNKPEGGICHILHHQKQIYRLPLCQGPYKMLKQLQLSMAEQINKLRYSLTMTVLIIIKRTLNDLSKQILECRTKEIKK